MKLGVFTQWVKASSIEELAERISKLELQCVVLDAFPGLSIDFDHPEPDICRRIASAFAQAGVEIAAVGGYTNLAHPDPVERQAIHRRFEGLLRLSSEIGAPMLCSEAGTYHPKDEWEWVAANGTEDAFDDFVSAMRPLVAKAKDYNVVIGMEPYVMTIINTAQRAARLIEELGQEHLRLVCDPAGLLDKTTIIEQRTFLPDAFRSISPSIGLVHVEDCRPDPNGHFFWLPAGRGLLDYPLFMDLVVQSGYNGPLILEHLSEVDLPAARQFVQQQWSLAQKRAGVRP